jgi:2-polyprenyl-3-methyl-5-hydroxy-6-metoxy-1,4-benzoquinol methylase
VIAPRYLPPAFTGWNSKWHAPFGRRSRLTRLVGAESAIGRRIRGPFAFQANNGTRVFEYPWVYSKIAAHAGSARLDIVEIGGSLAGMQWVLAREGHRVTNVDPGMAARGVGWEVGTERHEELSRTFDAPVRLINRTLDQANLPDQSADVVLSVSTIEHFAPPDLAEFATHARRILRPNGIVVLTIDLFLDLAPFSAVASHDYGTNVDVRALLSDAGLTLRDGVPAEIHGFPEFSAGGVMANLRNYLVGQPYPALAQCLVAVSAAR